MAAAIVNSKVLLSSKVLTQEGTSGADIFAGPVNNLSEFDKLNARGGIDTLEFTGLSTRLAVARFTGVKGIDRIDVTAGKERIDIDVSEQMVKQSDKDSLAIAFGDNDMILDTGPALGGKVVLEGSGRVQLGSRDQSVTVADRFNGDIVSGEGDDTLFGGTGADRISAGAGNDFIGGGGGNDTLSGGAGVDRFVLSSGTGTDRITDYDTSNVMEAIDIRGVATISDFGDLTIEQVGRDASVDLGGGDKLVLSGIKVGDLNEHDFIFNGDQEPKNFYFKAGASAEEIQAVIDAAPAGATIHLAAGNYRFTERLVIDRDDIKLLGAGEDKTKIVLEAKEASDGRALYIGTGAVEDEAQGRAVELAATTKAGSNQIKLDNVAGVNVGDVVYISEANSSSWLKETGNDHISVTSAPLREMLATVKAVRGNVVYLDQDAPYTFKGGEATFEVRDVLRDVEVGGFSITTDLGVADKYRFENTNKQFQADYTVRVDNATDVNLHDIKITNSASVGFSFQYVVGIEGNNLTTIGSHNKGDSGNGYAFYFNEAFDNTFKNLHDEDMRHGVLFSSGSAEHYNDIHVAFTNRDINFHGSPDSGNKVEVDRMEMDYKGNFGFSAVQGGDPDKHPLSTISKNDVTFSYLQADYHSDVVYAHEDGGEIRGGDGHDTIYGGKSADKLFGQNFNDRILGRDGDDRIEGNDGTDVLSGGEGSDTFVFRRGDDRDVITDFEAGSKGDKIDLSTTGVASLKLLAIRQVGDDVAISLGAGHSLTLEGTDADDLRADNFIFSKRDEAIKLVGDRFDLGMTGGRGDDTFMLHSHYILKDKPIDIIGGEGTDRFVLTLPREFDSSFLGEVEGVDILDLSERFVSARIDRDFVVQADEGYVTVKVGDAGARLTTSGITKADSVRISGDDLVLLGADGARVSSAGGAINVLGGVANDVIEGGSKGDRLAGGKGDDTLGGGAGNDKLDGGAGVNKVTGGTGADQFQIHDDGTRDIFNDFKVGEDEITIGDGEFKGLSALKAGSNFFSGSDAAPKSNIATLYFDTDTDVLWFDVNGTGRGGAEEVAHFANVSTLSVSDFEFL